MAVLRDGLKEHGGPVGIAVNAKDSGIQELRNLLVFLRRLGRSFADGIVVPRRTRRKQLLGRRAERRVPAAELPLALALRRVGDRAGRMVAADLPLDHGWLVRLTGHRERASELARRADRDVFERLL